MTSSGSRVPEVDQQGQLPSWYKRQQRLFERAAGEKPLGLGHVARVAETEDRIRAEKRAEARRLGASPPPAHRTAVYTCSRCGLGHYIGTAPGGLCRGCASE